MQPIVAEIARSAFRRWHVARKALTCQIKRLAGSGLARRSKPDGPTQRCTVTVMATSDLHLHLCPWDYYADRPAPGTGLASAAGRIRDLRRSMPNALLLDNGDFLQGTALGEALADARPPGPRQTHPMVEAMNLLDYDAVALGNHDFNYGLEFLGAALAGARFPVLCANLRRTDGGPTLFAGWTILERQVTCEDGRQRPLRLGVAGFLPPQVMIWDSAHLANSARAEGIVAAARRIVPQMIGAGAEVVVALCHSGIGTAEGGEDPGAEHAALTLAAVPGIDAVVAGHSHQVFPGTEFTTGPGIDVQAGQLAGKPACMPGYAASHLGLLRLALERSPGQRWRCTGGTGSTVSLAAVAGAGPPDAMVSRAAVAGAGPPTDPAPLIDASDPLRRLCEAAHQATRRHLDRPAGTAEVAVTSLFAMTGDCVATRLVARAQRWHVARMLEATPQAGIPVLAAASPARVGGRGGPANYTDLPPGPLRERDLAALCPFPNAIRALRLTGREIAAWLEHGAGAFCTVPPGSRDAPLLNPDWPAYNFDLIEGLTYEIDLAAPGGRRIRNLCHGGQPVLPDAEFILATTSYRAAGGGAFPGCGDPARVVLSAPTLVRSIVGAYLAIEGPFSAPDAPIWRFASMPGTTAVLETGAGALAHLPRAGMEPLGIGDAGFLRMRLHL
jgi:2',3'-cyclic-nucleotide 2'-phosphodiesterase / 3'-nucleotidase